MRLKMMMAVFLVGLMGVFGCGDDDSNGGNNGANNGDQDAGTQDTAEPDDADEVAGCAPVDELGRLTSDITEDTVISLDSGCRVVEGHIEVSANLTLEEGVSLYFEENAGLNIRGGTLTARGTEEDPVVLTSTDPTPGYWSGVQYIDTRSTQNVLEHVVIEYAGGQAFDGAGEASLVLNSTGITGDPVRVAVDNVTIRNSAALGMYVEELTEFESFSNNTFTENGAAPIRIAPTLLGVLDSESSFVGNDSDFVLVQPVSDGNITTGDHSWAALDVPYRVRESFEVGGDAHIDIEPGATIEFEEGLGINVQGGTLSAVGTADDPVTFRGAEQIDTFWQGIQFIGTRSADNRLEQVTISHASNGSFSGAGTGSLVLNSSGITGDPVDVALESVTIDGFGDGAAVYVEPDTTLTSCSNLSGFTPADVTGDGADDFITECGL